MHENRELLLLKEGNTKFYVHAADFNTIPSKSMNVFYNEKMVINRDLTNLALNAYNLLYHQEPMVIVDTMAASGVGAIRMMKNCSNVKKIYINDINPLAIDLVKKNIKLNEIPNSLIEISQLDSSLLLNSIINRDDNYSERPSVISIDPFGTPNKYIDSCFKTIQKLNGLLCITATDTAVLFGVREKACMRKYMAKSLNNEYNKETGARILIHFLSRIANINGMGINPILTFYSGHFLRIFALTYKDKRKISKSFENYGYIVHCNNCGTRSVMPNNPLKFKPKCSNCNNETSISYAGPLWTGEIHNADFIQKILDLNELKNYDNKDRIAKLLKMCLDEIEMPVTYYNIHRLSKTLALSNIPKIEEIIRKINTEGFKASRTHFDFVSIKTDMDIGNIIQILTKK